MDELEQAARQQERNAGIARDTFVPRRVEYEMRIQALEEENARLREAISPGRPGNDTEHYVKVAERMRGKETRIYAMAEAKQETPSPDLDAQLRALTSRAQRENPEVFTVLNTMYAAQLMGYASSFAESCKAFIARKANQ